MSVYHLFERRQGSAPRNAKGGHTLCETIERLLHLLLEVPTALRVLIVFRVPTRLSRLILHVSLHWGLISTRPRLPAGARRPFSLILQGQLTRKLFVEVQVGLLWLAKYTFSVRMKRSVEEAG